MSKTKWMGDQRVVEVPGLRPFYPHKEGEHAQIDANIADIVRRLNDLGAVTECSCSGMLADHREPDHWTSGYVTFRIKPGRRIVSAFERCGFSVEEGGWRAYVRDFSIDHPGPVMHDREAGLKWDALRRLLA